MKIGLVLSQPPSYSETFFNTKIKGLQSHGQELVLFVQKNVSQFDLCPLVVAPKLSRSFLLRSIQALGIGFSLLPHFSTVRRFIRSERESNRTSKQIFKNLISNAHILKADVDWLHFGFTTLALQSENVAKAIGAKMAISCRGYDMDVFPLKHKNPYQLIWDKVDKVHVISQYMKAQALSHGMSPETPIQVITPAIDLSKFNAPFHKDTKDTLQLTTVARLHWIKGLLPTLEALALLKIKGLSFKYQIIGTGSQYEELAFAIHQLDLKEEVTLIGQQSQNQIIRRLEETDIYVQYSYSEGFCNAVLEAQAMGCLCIVSDGGALPENVLHNETGIVVPKGEVKKLANAIMNLTRIDEDEQNKLVSNAKKRIESNFSIEDQITQFMAFYAE